MTTVRDLVVYNKAFEAAIEVHQATMEFPKYETMELGGQIRRASKSVAINIAEEYGRQSSENDFKYFLRVALGSCEEVRAELQFCHRLGYLDGEAYAKLDSAFSEVGKMLVTMIKSG